MKFSIVIPTYNREVDLGKCLDSILLQSLLPSEVVIVDDGSLSFDFIRKYKDKMLNIINFIYYKKDHHTEKKGSSESRNKSLELVSNETFFILDDDVVLDIDFCRSIIEVWSKNEDVNLIGVGGIIKNRRKIYKLEKYYYILFGINSRYSWDVNDACYQVWDEDIKNLSFGYYAHGGVCSYNLTKTKELKFSTFSGGRTALEDVGFCLRAKLKGYGFIIQPEAQLYHYPSVVSRENMFLMGYKESCNRKIIFKSINANKTIFLKLWFYWSSFGWVLRNFLIGNFKKGAGMVKGFID